MSASRVLTNTHKKKGKSYQWNRADGRKRESQRGERVSNLYTIRYDRGGREGEIPELGRAVRAFYIGYVLGTSHEPDRLARLPLHPKEERQGGP